MSYDSSGVVVAGQGLHGEGLGDVVAEGVGGVGAVFVGLLYFAGGGAEGVDRPSNVFEIFEEFGATGMDQETALLSLAAESRVDTVDAITNGGVDVGVEVERREDAAPVGEEVADDGPIGSTGGGAAMSTAGIAIDVDLQRTLKVGHAFVEFVGTNLKSLAGGFGIGIGADDDFFDDVDDVFDALHEEHAHGVDVEIERPDERMQAVEADGVDVVFAMEGVIDAVLGDSVELAAVLLPKGIFVGTAAGTFKFRLFD